LCTQSGFGVLISSLIICGASVWPTKHAIHHSVLYKPVSSCHNSDNYCWGYFCFLD